MSVTAKSLSKTGAHGSVFSAIVRDQLLIIDDALSRAEKKWGRNIIDCELPSVFPNTGLNRKETERMVYSMIIRSLLGRGFGIRILIVPEKTVLYVEWVTVLDQAQVGAMNRILKKTRIYRRDLNTYLDRPED